MILFYVPYDLNVKLICIHTFIIYLFQILQDYLIQDPIVFCKDRVVNEFNVIKYNEFGVKEMDIVKKIISQNVRACSRRSRDLPIPRCCTCRRSSWPW